MNVYCNQDRNDGSNSPAPTPAAATPSNQTIEIKIEFNENLVAYK